jgi:hypothetical protein
VPVGILLKQGIQQARNGADPHGARERHGEYWSIAEGMKPKYRDAMRSHLGTQI